MLRCYLQKPPSLTVPLQQEFRNLHHATYKGYIGYNKPHSDGFLTQKRINHSDDDFEYIKGDFEPIVSEELWDRCEEIRQRRNVQLLGEDGAKQKFGRKEPSSVWTAKLRCSCGSSFRRFLWHSNQNGQKSYGYECYRQKRSVSWSYLSAHGLDASQACTTHSSPYWHIDLMAQKVFQSVWQERKDAVLLACKMIEECAVQQQERSSAIQDGLQAKVDKLQKRLERLRDTYADGDITREELLNDKQRYTEQLEKLKQQIQDLEASGKDDISGIDIKRIEETLNQWIDLSAPVLPEAVIDQFILQVVVVDNDTFNWTLNFSSDVPDSAKHFARAKLRGKLTMRRGRVPLLIRC